MTIAFYMNCVSAHQLPLAKEVAKLVGEENFIYVYAGESDQVYQQATYALATQDKSILETADIVLSGMRDVELFERRAKRGLKTYYTSERWFKPPLGVFRMLKPGYCKMARRFVKWVNTDPNAKVLAIGPWAWADFVKMGVKEEKLVKWGYFVGPGVEKRCRCRKEGNPLEVLWVGRDLAWKRVKDIERAVSELARLKRVEVSLTILTGVTPEEVRRAMREHDTFIMASNAYEGWGAVVSEALEEGMNVIGTFEAGASAAILPRERLYHAGDVRALASLIEQECCEELPRCEIGEWTAKNAAKRLMEMI